ncbi:type II toxin-antitoxin system RelB/DinJ family antitoxin [Collinsella sp. An2]|uniref:type II toxin-antitoxin system RelB/DinJ family antitoxin n=1 Tax=Collinsella sp. An2 TaxID=1965585 RepID=UPI000B37C256|nr:type II toxin-antitoxin system RelB/DinJ family antitoxin [Collinsella sp. An2]OUP09780.1 translation repressor RelB [Collinsella sp. An2]
MSCQLATRIDDVEAERFREITRRLGTTPADAMRIFVSAFNAHRGFPFDVRLAEPAVEAFSSEQEAAEFSDHLAMRMMSDAW